MPSESVDPPFERIAIVGLGLIGGSVALAVRRAWPQVVILGVDGADIASRAQQQHVIDGSRESVSHLHDADVIVLATPVPDIIENVRTLTRDACATVVTDVGSTKRAILAAADGLAAFVGGHPMAGAALGGLDHARATLFDGRPWLLVRPSRTSAEVLARVDRFVLGLGAAPAHVDAATHDRAMAFVSHVPQLLSSALMASAGQAVGDDGLALSGAAFADMTRIASSPPDIWRGILATNADFIAEALTEFLHKLPTTPAGIGDQSATDRLFLDARAWSRRFVTSHSSRH